MNNEFQLMGLGKPPVKERRQGRDDFWVRALRVAGLLTYPLLFINLAIFVAVIGIDQETKVMEQYEQSTVERISSWVHLNMFMPIMVAGLLIGIISLFLSIRRSRRKYDLKFMYPALFTALSVVGLLVYFFIRK